MGRGSTARATGRKKSEANCSVWILAPTLPSAWPWASYLTSVHCHFPVCETGTRMFLPHRDHELYVEYLEQFLEHSRFHMGVTYYYVQKLLYCSNYPELTWFQKLEKLVESLCQTWDRQLLSQGEVRLPAQFLFYSSPNHYVTEVCSIDASLFLQDEISI